MIEILIVEDDRQISNLIKVNLKDAGYKCTCAYDGVEAGNIVEQQYFDLVLLDIMLPGVNGYELFDYIREKEIPVIFLTAKAQVKDIVKGLKMGAEDYLTKPFEIIELLARVETVLRRYHKQNTVVRFQDVTVDLSSHVVKKGEKIVNLTLKEYELLLLFVRNKNVALFRDKIYESVWREEYMGNSRTVDLHVQRLRKKLNWEKQITAVYKVGYRVVSSEL